MAGLTIPPRTRPPRKRRGRRRRGRVGVHSDITPMVDIAFLLLIFYMVTTVFAKPQALEVTMPPDDERPVDVDHMLRLWVDDNNEIWWARGEISPSKPPVSLPGGPDTLKHLLVDQNQADTQLVILAKVHREADFESMVQVLDELDRSERIIRQYRPFSSRFAFDKWSPTDDRVIADARANQPNREVTNE
jgi:biopolymer transport protein ExbD